MGVDPVCYAECLDECLDFVEECERICRSECMERPVTQKEIVNVVSKFKKISEWALRKNIYNLIPALNNDDLVKLAFNAPSKELAKACIQELERRLGLMEQ